MTVTKDLGTRAVTLATVVLLVVAFVALAWPLPARDDSGRHNRERLPIVPTPSSVTFDLAELPYTIVIPNGFVLSPYTQADATLVPEAWLPTTTRIELRNRELGSNVSGMDAALKYVRENLVSQRFSNALETRSAADGSAAVEYRTSHAFETVVFHGARAVFVNVSYHDAHEESVLREASRTVVRSMRFR